MDVRLVINIMFLLLAYAVKPANTHCRATAISESCIYNCAPPDSCPSHGNATHNPFRLGGEGAFCCPGYFLTIHNVCQICNDVTFMPDVNNCTCDCYECTDCGYPYITQCSRTSNTVCNVTKQTVVQVTSCSELPVHEESTSHPPTNQTITVPVTEDPEQPAEPKKSTGTGSHWVAIAIFLFIIVILFISILFICCCYLHTLADKEIPSDQTDGRQTLRQALQPLARYLCGRRTQSHAESGENEANGNETSL